MTWKGPLGEPLALDLVNTVVGTAQGEEDLLASGEGLRAWLAAQADRLDPDLAAEGADWDLAHVLALRAAVADAVDAVRHGRTPDLDGINALLRESPAIRQLAWDGSRVQETVERHGEATTRLLAALASSAADLLTDPGAAGIRGCEGPHCRVLFLPVNARRRWCSPAVCGNRVRVARYYEAHKA
jgi:predicted RNA-binding Zn ribbon-like protein